MYICIFSRLISSLQIRLIAQIPEPAPAPVVDLLDMGLAPDSCSGGTGGGVYFQQAQTSSGSAPVAAQQQDMFGAWSTSTTTSISGNEAGEGRVQSPSSSASFGQFESAPKVTSGVDLMSMMTPVPSQTSIPEQYTNNSMSRVASIIDMPSNPQNTLPAGCSNLGGMINNTNLNSKDTASMNDQLKQQQMYNPQVQLKTTHIYINAP
jgi:hypothetical protein